MSLKTSVLRKSSRNKLATPVVVLPLVASVLLSGCAAPPQWHKTVRNDTSEVDCITQQIDNPVTPVISQVSATSQPLTTSVIDATDVTYVDMSLQQVIQDAMRHSTVLRDIGGVVLRYPDTVKTGFASRLQETDPRFGMEAALSAFDAQLAATANFNNNNRIYNNAFFAGGTTAFTQDLHDYQLEISKRNATGSLMALRGVTSYDNNNAPANTFPSSWDTWMEAEVRQPLLQGGGLEFNRIAGPGATPGVYNGVLIARANNDINYAEFTASLRDFISNVENAYWDLYVAYREYDARKKATENALVIWQNMAAGTESGTLQSAKEALARQQYFQAKSAEEEALAGRLLEGTTAQNGSPGGTLQNSGGVLAAERRLRLLTGLPAADGRLIRTLDEPPTAEVIFGWETSMSEALRQRPELQRQQVTVKKKELELLAARNFLNPRLDAVGRYRWRGFGDDLLGSGNQGGTAPASSVGNFFTGDQQEWTLGVELTVPIGYRRAHAAVQNAELALFRARAIQKEQEREVVSDLNGAFTDVDRAYRAMNNNLNQYLAASDYVKALESRDDSGINEGGDRILDAHQRKVQAEIQFFRSRAEYAVALKNVHYEKGSLLHYKDLRVAEPNSEITELQPSEEVFIPPAGEISESLPPAVPEVEVPDEPVEIESEPDPLQLPPVENSDFSSAQPTGIRKALQTVSHEVRKDYEQFRQRLPRIRLRRSLEADEAEATQVEPETASR